MKKKFSKILGVGLTLVMVLALTASFALPVGASPDENAWSKLAYPAEGEPGGFFWDSTIEGGPGPIAKAIDGTLYAYAKLGATAELLKSTDGGRSWAKTYYSDKKPPDGVGVLGKAIVAIACSSIDEDVVYVADAAYVYKTEDGGDSFDFVSASTLETLMGDPDGGKFDSGAEITSLAVGYADEKPHVYIGVANTGKDNGVGYIYDVAFGGGWTDLKLARSVYGIGASPDFDSDALVVAVATGGGSTYVESNYGAAPAVWGEVELKDDDDTPDSFPITEASDPAFPEDFDATDAYEFFVGVVGPAHHVSPNNGGVYRVYDANFLLLDYVDVDISSLDLVGEVGDTLLLAGAQDTADVWWSTDDGDTWDNAAVYGVAPTGEDETYVVMDDDFADNETAWAATSGAEGAVSLSVDGGEIWHGISLIHTAITKVLGVALSTAYAVDETLFLLTGSGTQSLFKYDGANWERVFESTLYGNADLVAVSPDFATDETVFVGYKADKTIFRSTDAGISFLDPPGGLRVAPPDLKSWAIIDSDTIIAGGHAEVHKTENYGRRTWATYAVTGSTDDVSSLAVVGETIILGDATGHVFVSEDAGETWEQVGDAAYYLGFSAATLVAFDGDIIYAASKDVVGRCVIDLDEDWADQTWEEIETPETTVTTSVTISADSFKIAPTDTTGTWFTLVETNGKVMVSALVGSPRIRYDAASDKWTVTFHSAKTEEVLVTAIGTATPCSGTVKADSWGPDIGLTVVDDTDKDVFVTISIAAGDTGSFSLPDVEEVIEEKEIPTLGLQAASGIVISPDGTLYVVDATAGVGAWRSLNPDAEYVTDAVFEAVSYKVASSAALQLAGFSVGSNVLWATNTATGYKDELWTYEDTLATEVILSTPVSGMAVTATDEATLGWFELTGAEEYEINVNTRDDFLTGTAIAVADVEETWVTVTGLDAGTTYYWRVRAATGEPLLSRYSEARTFITALEKVTAPAMWYPENGADDVVLSPVLSWGEVTGATSYKIIVATEPGFGVANRLVETMVVTNFYPCEVDFSYNTTYYWRVKAYSDSVVVSDWQAGMFTTMARPVPVVPPVEVTPAPPAPEITVEVPAPQVIEVPPAQVISPTWIYVIIGVGALLVIAVIVLIVRTRRVS